VRVESSAAVAVDDLCGEVTITVPIVYSTRRHRTSALCASVGMAIAYARENDRQGARYRDLLELCLREHPATMDTVVALTRRLFPDVPVSRYAPDEITLDDAILLARMAAKRRGHVLPVLTVDRAFHPEVAGAHLDTVVLCSFATENSAEHSFWDPEPPDIGGWRMSSRVEVVPAGFECTVFGWLPPVRFPRGSTRFRASEL
jgi:hypothetical protein